MFVTCLFINISEQKESSQDTQLMMTLYIWTHYLDVAMCNLDVTKGSWIINRYYILRYIEM